ncbi:hypothetical protein D210916BOD24_07950 [Alteromonas sp. D210916BOD_24]|uniref:acyltransferase family protein n=1 Tax=Alteromonas sp. D210916BOD_24 TaxID=3157618 RepID=UPI00399CFA71
MSSQKHHFEPLTWLRGIAAFLVVISHSLRATQDTYFEKDEPVNWLVLRILDLGTFGVLLFFTLSGTTLYLSHTKQSNQLNVMSFYIKRFFRIWPAFAVSLMVYFAFSFVFRSLYGEPSGHWIERQFLQLPSAVDFFAYLTLSFNISGQLGLFNNAYWSLPVEFQYYLLFPIIILLLPVLKSLSPILMGIALYLAFKLDLGLLSDSRMLMLGFTFCGGVFLGYIYRAYVFHLNQYIGTFIFIFLLSCASIVTNQFVNIPNVPVLSNTWIMLGLIALAVVAVILFSEIKLPKFITNQFFKLGEFSYSFYLYHNLFIGCAVLFLIQFNIVDAALRYLVVIMIGGVLSLYVAYKSYLHVELPFMKIGSKIANR